MGHSLWRTLTPGVSQVTAAPGARIVNGPNGCLPSTPCCCRHSLSEHPQFFGVFLLLIEPRLLKRQIDPFPILEDCGELRKTIIYPRNKSDSAPVIQVFRDGTPEGNRKAELMFFSGEHDIDSRE